MRTLCILSILFAAACGGGSDKNDTGGGCSYQEEDSGGCGGEESASGGGVYDPASGTAAVRGVVKWEGKAPRRAPIDVGTEKYCKEHHRDKPLLSETTVVGPDGGLANVFVHVTKGLEGWKFPKPEGVKELDQQECTYVPHVMGVRVGQTLLVHNSDPILHNVHAIDTRTHRDAFNFGQSTKGSEAKRTFRRPKLLSVKCDVHGWMQSYIHVVKDPFYAVTNEKGAFEIDKLPPGSYTLTAWHERWGTRTATVTVGDGETKEITFTFSAK